MSQTLENLRQKPETHRRRVAAASTSGIMVVIVAIWITTFPARFPELAHSNVDQAAAIINGDAQTQVQADQPLNALKTNAANGYASMTEALSALGQASSTQKSTVSNGVVISDQDPNQIQIVQ